MSSDETFPNQWLASYTREDSIKKENFIDLKGNYYAFKEDSLNRIIDIIDKRKSYFVVKDLEKIERIDKKSGKKNDDFDISNFIVLGIVFNERFKENTPSKFIKENFDLYSSISYLIRGYQILGLGRGLGIIACGSNNEKILKNYILLYQLIIKSPKEIDSVMLHLS